MTNGDQWQAMISAFEAYVRRTGNGEVPASYSENTTLGRWVAMIRYRRKVGELEPAFIAELDRKGFCWSPKEQMWASLFRKLLAFRVRFKHCDVPATWAGDISLASWVARQRHLRKLGTLSEERISRLDEVGFRWNVQGCKDDASVDRKLAEKRPVPQAVVSTPPTVEVASSPEPAEERLYHIGIDGYVQYDGVREIPAKLRHYLACHDDWPPYIPLPTEPTRFLLGLEGSMKVRRITWNGHGPLPADIIQYVNENGSLPPQA